MTDPVAISAMILRLAALCARQACWRSDDGRRPAGAAGSIGARETLDGDSLPLLAMRRRDRVGRRQAACRPRGVVRTQARFPSAEEVGRCGHEGGSAART
jgi:hypothetical protein